MALMFGIGTPTTNIVYVNGVTQTGRDWSSDLAKLSSAFDSTTNRFNVNVQNTPLGMNLTQINGTTQSADDWTAIFRAIRDRINEMSFIAGSTTPLPANGTYTSSDHLVNGWGKIVGTVYADQAGTLYIEQGADGTNYDSVSSFSVGAGQSFGFMVDVVAPHVRVRYVNGATAQSAFRLFVFTRRI